MKRTSIHWILTLCLTVLLVNGCRKGYVTPAHTSLSSLVTSNKITFLDPLNIDAVLINGLPVNFGLNTQGFFGTTANLTYPLSVVNGQTFNLKLQSKGMTLLDSSLTVNNSGLDSYIVYTQPSNNTKLHIYTLHTDKQSTPSKGMAKIRFVNVLPGLPGDGALTVQFSRKQQININNGQPLQFGTETPYIEVPFGIYQPLLTDRTKKPIINYVRSFFYQDYTIFQWPQISLEPGGAYTFLISKGYDRSSDVVSQKYLVATQLIQDEKKLQQPVGKVKFIHVDPYLNNIKLVIDGQPLDNTPLIYGADENATGLSQGDHKVQVYDLSGNKLIEQTVTILDQQIKIAFIAQSKEGIPEIKTVDLSDLAPANNFIIGAFFNFSPDSPPVSFLSENSLGDDKLLSTGFSPLDSLTTNVPYLRIPKLNGQAGQPLTEGNTLISTELALVFEQNYGGAPPQKLTIAFNVNNNIFSTNEVVRGATITYPFFEYQSFATSEKLQGTVSYIDGDTGYYLVMLTGLRYNAPVGKQLKVKVIKYVE